MSVAVDVIVQRLDGLRRSGRGWVARCPAHADRTPSLSVAEGDDGQALLHCFGGCDVTDVLAAIDLTLADLFPERTSGVSLHGSDKRRRALRETGLVAAVNVIDREASAVVAAATMVQRGEELTSADRERLALAMQRITDAREVFA